MRVNVFMGGGGTPPCAYQANVGLTVEEAVNAQAIAAVKKWRAAHPNVHDFAPYGFGTQSEASRLAEEIMQRELRIAMREYKPRGLHFPEWMERIVR